MNPIVFFTESPMMLHNSTIKTNSWDYGLVFGTNCSGGGDTRSKANEPTDYRKMEKPQKKAMGFQSMHLNLN